MNTLAGLPVDRPPVFAVLGAYGARLTGVDLRTLYSDAAAYVAGQQALQKEFGFDMVMTGFDYSLIAEAFGGQVAWFDDQSPNMKRPKARQAKDILALPLPDPQATARLPMALDVTRRLADLYKGEVPVIGVLPGPCILPALIAGIEEWMEAVLFDPELAQRLLDHTSSFYVAWANALLDAGADCLVMTEGMAAASLVPRKIFERQCLAHLRAVFARIRGPNIFHHSGGAIQQVLDLLPGLDGLAGVVASSQDDLTEARRLLGPAPALIGNLDNLTLPAIEADEVCEMCLAMLRTAAPAGPFILSSSGADIPQATPPANLRAMVAASVLYQKEIGRA